MQRIDTLFAGTEVKMYAVPASYLPVYLGLKLPIVAHPVFIMIVWLPCVLLGMWAGAVGAPGV